MLYRLKDLSDAAVKNLHSEGNYKPHDRFQEKNNAIMRMLYEQLKEGRIDWINYLDPDHKLFRCFHRSPKYNGDVQFSLGYYYNGELVPTSDHHVISFEDMCAYGFPTGRWETGKVA